jgi:hypothetical protein
MLPTSVASRGGDRAAALGGERLLKSRHHFCGVAFSDGKPNSIPACARAGIFLKVLQRGARNGRNAPFLQTIACEGADLPRDPLVDRFHPQIEGASRMRWRGVG